jgi:hypothetical protein
MKCLSFGITLLLIILISIAGVLMSEISPEIRNLSAFVAFFIFVYYIIGFFVPCDAEEVILVEKKAVGIKQE